MKKLFYAVAVVILAVCLVLLFRLDGVTGKSEQPIAISAEELWDEFVTDKDAAKKKFDGIEVLVIGTVSEVTENFMGHPCVLLENGADSIPDGIFFMFPEESLEDVLTVEIGSTATIQGRCSIGTHIYGEDTPYVSIYDAAIIESHKLADTQPIAISAEELWGEFVADKESASKKYDGTQISVTGRVAFVSDNFMNQPGIQLENGEGGAFDGIAFMFPEESLPDVLATEIGSTVTIQGRCSIPIHLYGEEAIYIYVYDAVFT